MLGPIAWRTPPRDYGPWEQVVATLTDALVERGVEVTLFATGDSATHAELVSVVEHGYEGYRSQSPGPRPAAKRNPLWELNAFTKIAILR